MYIHIAVVKLKAEHMFLKSEVRWCILKIEYMFPLHT